MADRDKEKDKDTSSTDSELIGIDLNGNGKYEMVTRPAGAKLRDRRIRIGNVDMEHVAEDSLGRWLYRPLD